MAKSIEGIYSVFAAGTRSALWFVYGPGFAMYLGIAATGVASGEMGLVWGLSIFFIPLLPVLAILMLIYALYQCHIAALLFIPFVLAVLWFWLDEDRRLEAFFSIAVVTSLYTSLAGEWGPPDLLRVGCALGMLSALYAAIRLLPLMLQLVARERATEEEAEEQAVEEDRE